MPGPTVSQQREFELQVTGRSLIPRSVYDPVFSWMIQRRVKTILGTLSGTAYRYSAFPRSPAFRDVSGTLHNMTTDGKVILLWTDGTSHGNSDRVILALVDPATLEVEASVMRSGSGAIDVSLLTGKLALGQAIMMARFHIVQPGDGSAPVGTVQDLSATTYTIHGSSRAISPWSRPKLLDNGDWVRMGYQTNTADSPSVMLKATDATLSTWNYLSTVAYDAAPKRFIEGDFVETSAGNLLAWVGEEVTNDDTRYLWYVTSTDSGATWSSPTLYDTDVLTGNQPCLDLLVSGEVQGMLTDRSGTSGIDNNGMPIDNTRDKTGVAHFLSLDTSATDFRYRTMLAPFRGTDGGQCTVVEYEAGKIFFAYYGVRKIDELPKIIIGQFETEKLLQGY